MPHTHKHTLERQKKRILHKSKLVVHIKAAYGAEHSDHFFRLRLIGTLYLSAWCLWTNFWPFISKWTVFSSSLVCVLLSSADLHASSWFLRACVCLCKSVHIDKHDQAMISHYFLHKKYHRKENYSLMMFCFIVAVAECWPKNVPVSYIFLPHSRRKHVMKRAMLKLIYTVNWISQRI